MTVSLTEPFLKSALPSEPPGQISKLIKMIFLSTASPILDPSFPHAQPPSITSLILYAISPSPSREYDPDQAGISHLTTQEDLTPNPLPDPSSVFEGKTLIRQCLSCPLYISSPSPEVLSLASSLLPQVYIESHIANDTTSSRRAEVNQAPHNSTRSAIHPLRNLKVPKALPGLPSERRSLPPLCYIDALSSLSRDPSLNSSKPTHLVTAQHSSKWSLNSVISNRETKSRPTLLVNLHFSSKFSLFTDLVLLDSCRVGTSAPSLLHPSLLLHQSLHLVLIKSNKVYPTSLTSLSKVIGALSPTWDYHWQRNT